MEILVLLIPLSVALALLIAAGFWWSVRSGQFDDLEGPAHRILSDDDRAVAHSEPRTDTQPAASSALTSINPVDSRGSSPHGARYNHRRQRGSRRSGRATGRGDGSKTVR